jgi:MoaA/NifB/PqqE/SkfB family radical SAM enzyme
MSLYVQLTDKCNMSCLHCCFSCTGKGSFMSQAVFDKCLEIATNYSMDLTLGGGEPTLHPHILDWVMQAAIATVDVSMDLGCPAVLVITNGSKTKIALTLAKLAKLDTIQAELSQDQWHDPIDPKVVEAFKRYSKIRNVEDGIKEQGRAELNGLADMKGCACSALFIAPNGDFYQCGCKKTKLGNILTDEIPQTYWDNPDECESYLQEKELTPA